MKTLTDWYVTSEPYQPPESGFIIGGIRDGIPILTSIVVKTDGDVITTASGSIYKLLNVKETYRKWLLENGWSPNSLPKIIDRVDG